MIKNPKTLILDLEVTAHSGLYWGRSYETSIVKGTGYGQILSYAAKWLGQKTIVRGWIDFKRNKERSLVKELWELLNEANVVCGQNLKAFDLKWCNSAFIRYGLSPPSPYKFVDTKVEAKKYLYLPSYSLNTIADYFGLGNKLEHEGINLWQRCIEGDKKAWRRMKTYNAHDTNLTEKVYLLLRPFITTKQDYLQGTCSHCRGTEFQRRGFTLDRKYQRVVCKKCYGWGQVKVKKAPRTT